MSQSQNIHLGATYNQLQQQYRTNRWTTGTPEQLQGPRQIFNRYASANQTSQQTNTRFVQEQRRFVTEVSQISQNGDGFKKTKYNQLETLKELKQEYQILRNLPLQEELIDKSHRKKQISSSSLDSQNQDSASSSSKTMSKKKRKGENQDIRSVQILTLEKRQLELVIGNSMRKIQELLNNEIEYKKTIHVLQLQLDSKTSDQKIEALTKTLKRTQSEYNDKIENLRREIERLNHTIKQLEQKNESLESDYSARGEELNRYLQEKRTLEDQLRAEKDKVANLEIEVRRVTMESQILEKDKNSQIQRLKSFVEARDPTSIEYKKMEEELRSNKYKYEKLLEEFEKFRSEISFRPKEIIRENKNEDQLKIFELLINHLKDESAKQNRESIDLINSMVAKLDDSKKGGYDGRLLEELFNLRNEVTSLKKDKEDRSMNGLAESVAEYQYKIQSLEQEISNGTISKENLLKEYENIKSSYEYAREEYSALNEQYQKLKKQLQSGDYGYGDSNETIRNLRRQLDEALFMVEKSKKEIEFNVGLVKTENQSTVRLLNEQIARIEGEKELLKAELNRMRNFYESKIQQKNALLEKTTNQLTVITESRQKTLLSYKNNTEKQINELVRKMEGMAQLNQRYLSQSSYISNLQRELHELRYAVKRMKTINDGVDHLWSVKETEYQNVNEILQHLKAQ